MATRFYGRENASAPVSVTVSASWTSSASPFASRGMFTTSDSGDTLTTVSGFNAASGSTQCHRQWISEPMQSGHTFDTTVTYKMQVQVFESAADDNLFSRMGVRIVSQDGTTVRHTVLAVGQYQGGEWTTSLLNKIIANSDPGTGSYTTVSGDRLVVEFGHRDNAGTTPDGASRWGSAGTGDLGENESDTSTTLRPWFETSLNLTFVASTITGTGAITMPMFTVAATGSVLVAGAGAITMPMFTVTGTGIVGSALSAFAAWLRARRKRAVVAWRHLTS